jgi:hypothetical protein
MHKFGRLHGRGNIHLGFQDIGHSLIACWQDAVIFRLIDNRARIRRDRDRGSLRGGIS